MFCELLKQSGNKINFGYHIFILNIYLFIELILNIIAIALILYLLEFEGMLKYISSFINTRE